MIEVVWYNANTRIKRFVGSLGFLFMTLKQRMLLAFSNGCGIYGGTFIVKHT